jgi:1,2-diacylglycerol 3-alpha-glucosyltransferase
VKSPSRVLFVFPNMPFAGGAERQSVVLIRGLRDLGDEVAVLTLKERGGHFRELEADAIPAFCAEMRSRVDLAGWRRALVAPPFSPDVVVSRSISAQIFGHVAAKRFQVPHVTLEQSPVDRTGEGLRLRVHQQVLLRLIARFVDVAIAVSASQISDLVRRGFARERIRVIPNSIDDARLRQGRAREEMRRELGVGSEEFLALLVGNLRPEKRVPLFVRAVAAAHKQNSRIHGLVAGEGSAREELEREVRKTAGAVRLLACRSDVADLMRAADVVCNSSDVEGSRRAARERFERRFTARRMVERYALLLDAIAAKGGRGGRCEGPSPT